MPKARSRAARIAFARCSRSLAEDDVAIDDVGVFFFFFLLGADNRNAVKTDRICASYPRRPPRAASPGFTVEGSRARRAALKFTAPTQIPRYAFELTNRARFSHYQAPVVPKRSSSSPASMASSSVAPSFRAIPS